MEPKMPAGVLIESPISQKLDFPAIDVLSYIFASGNSNSKEAPQFFDAARPDEHFSLQEAELYVRRFGKGLQKLGLQPGDKVLLCSTNQLFFPVVLWGIIAAGCVFTGASPTASVFELSHQIRDSEAKIVLAAPEQLNVALKAAIEAGIGADNVWSFDGLREAHSTPQKSTSTSTVQPWTQIWASASESQSWKWREVKTQAEAEDTTAVINYSSGTTGLPKGVELSHYNLVSNTEQLIFKRGLVGPTNFGRNRTKRLEESGERWLAPLPMYHAFGQVYYTMVAPRVGAKVCVIRKFDLVKYLDYINIYQITFINLVPTILRMMAKMVNPTRFDLSSLLMVGSGSAPLDIDIARQVEKRFLRPGVQIKQGWGMTETACNVTGFAPDDFDDGRSIGWLNPGCRARIVPVKDREFENAYHSTNSPVGEIWVTGPNIMKGYWKKPQETAEAVVEDCGYRWLRTGDIGYADSRGCLYIVDRIKELIKVKGLQVSPVELEKILMSHPGVLDAAVVGIKSDGKEFPRAFIVKKNASLTAKDLDGLVKNRLAPHKWLTGGIFFVDHMPRTASGKIIKRELLSTENTRKSKL